MAKLPSANIRQKILLGFCFPLLLILFSSVLIHRSIENSLETADWVRHTQEVITSARYLGKLLVDMETGKRGYIITGRENFLEPYIASREIWANEMNGLIQLVDDNPSQVERAKYIASLADKWMKNTTQPIIDLRRKLKEEGKSAEEVESLIKSESGKIQMDYIRIKIQEFIDVENDLMDERTESARTKASTSLFVASTGLPLLALLGIAVAVFTLSRSILEPLQRLLDATQSVSEGNLTVIVEEKSSDEFGNLAKAFNRMTESVRLSREEIQETNERLTRTHADLEIKAKELEITSAHKSQFLANMSHEIRTPMNGVLGMLRMLERQNLDEKGMRCISMARQCATSLMSIIDDILDFSKIESGKINLETIAVNLRELVNNFAQTSALSAQEKGLELILDVSNLECEVVKGDPVRIGQILDNLVSNAIKFTETGEIVISVSSKVIDNGQVKLRCSMQDTGVGIEADKISGLFESFTQEDYSTTREFGGTGLGLAIVQELCELMGGKVYASSLKGQGSQFTFDIFLEKGDLPLAQVPCFSLANNNVLLLVDNNSCRSVVGDILKKWDACVYEVDNSEEALEFLKAVSFDLILLDDRFIDSEEENFLTLLQEHPLHSKLPRVLMCSVTLYGSEDSPATSEMCKLIPKPVLAEELRSTFSELGLGSKIIEVMAEPEISSKGERNKLVLEKARILVVEDNIFNQNVVCTVLEDLGVEIGLANNGVEALEKLATARYQLVLMDCQMPEMDGYEATRKIRAGDVGSGNVKIPIVALTANVMVGDREKCLDAGMDDYLPKPLDPELLEKTLVSWLSTDSATETMNTQNGVGSDQLRRVWDEQRFLDSFSSDRLRAKAFLDAFVVLAEKSLNEL